MEAVKKRLEKELSDKQGKAAETLRTQLERKHSEELRRVQEEHRVTVEDVERRREEEKATALEQMKKVTDNPEERMFWGIRRDDVEVLEKEHKHEG